MSAAKMGRFPSRCEIVEVESESRTDQKPGDFFMTNSYSIEDDINRLFQAIDIRNSARSSGETVKNHLRRSAMKRPMRPGMSPVSGIGISEPVSLKQALRGLCIAQASDLAAMKRMSKPGRSSGVSEAGNIKRLYRAVVVEANGSGIPLKKGQESFVEISLVPDITVSSPKPEIIPQSMEIRTETTKKHESADSSSVSTSAKDLINSVVSDDGRNGKSLSCALNFNTGKRISKSFIFRSKNTAKNKQKPGSSASCSSNLNGKVDNDLNSSTTSSQETPTSSSTYLSLEVNSRKLHFSLHCSNGAKSHTKKGDGESMSREKGEFSQSSKSSVGDHSTCTSTSEESSVSGSSLGGKKPHMSKDLRWEAIHQIQKQHGSLGLRHFKLLKRLGCGDIGTVYLAELSGTSGLFALKVMDNEFLETRKKLLRVQTEREILQMLDHPFLPTLFAHFVSDKLSCLVMEYCPGGDLHVLRQKQPLRSFSEQAARFYVAEVLLALEYLHMLGVVYRDLKPENILVRDDGHIMLSDFDLSLRCASANAMVLKSSLPVELPEKTTSPCTESSCIDPFCLQPSWQVSCFTPRLLSAHTAKSRKPKSDAFTQVGPLPQLVVEPTNARSNSFVGTHEYLAPEIIRGDGHGSAVDWWTFGIFLFELLYGRTPFKGSGNEDTLANIVSKSLKFPNCPMVGFHARDLIRGLLVKDPESRLGSVKGATEIKQHPFFEGLNWALIRCAIPPELPKSYDLRASALAVSQKQENTRCKEVELGHKEFEVF